MKTTTNMPHASSATADGAKPMQYVFTTEKLTRYQFPTHTTDLVMDRTQAACSEVFVVVLRPNQAPPLHKHEDTEQIFHIFAGHGVLTIGEQKQQFPSRPGTWCACRSTPGTLFGPKEKRI